MNKLLAGAIRFLNGFVAVIFVIVGFVVGNVFSDRFSDVPPGAASLTILGAVMGFMVAVIACGLLALFIEMRTELIKIREILEKQRPTT
jgi:drug/metabolite transporter (DMT)-like permease